MSWIIRSSTTPMSTRAGGETAGPHGLDEFRLGQVRPRGDQRRVESFDVSDLQDGLAVPGRGDQFVGFAHAGWPAAFRPARAGRD